MPRISGGLVDFGWRAYVTYCSLGWSPLVARLSPHDCKLLSKMAWNEAATLCAPGKSLSSPKVCPGPASVLWDAVPPDDQVMLRWWWACAQGRSRSDSTHWMQ